MNHRTGSGAGRSRRGVDDLRVDDGIGGIRDLGIRDLGGEGILIAAGGRAVLLQLAERSVGRGVARHSDFVARPLDRLLGTLDYVYAVVFGDDDDIRAVRRRVNAAHARVHGESMADDPAYDAYDPDLQLWVAATLYDTAILMWESIFGALDTSSAERIYREYAVLGTALQVPPGAWPADRVAFRAYFDDRVSHLTVTPETRRVARALLQPANVPAWVRAGMPLASLLTAGLLPPEIRTAYGMNWSPTLQRRFDGWLRLLRVMVPRLPRRVRALPRDLSLARLRASR